MRCMRMSLAALTALTLGALAVPEPAAAHCDSLDGPVVTAARQALETGNVDLVMVWVRPQDGDGLASRLADHAAEALGERYERVQALGDYDQADVEARRAYVHAYVEYIHFVERLQELIQAEAGEAHGDR